MNLVEFVPPTPHPLWKLCPQMGITDVIVKVNPDLTGLPDPWRFETLSSIVSRLRDAGLTVVGLEGDPFDMIPIKEYGGNGQDERCPSRELEEMARHFGKRIAFIHVRDVEGDKTDFTELFHDRELTPEGTPGYFTLGRLFANGYLKALMKGTDNAQACRHAHFD